MSKLRARGAKTRKLDWLGASDGSRGLPEGVAFCHSCQSVEQTRARLSWMLNTHSPEILFFFSRVLLLLSLFPFFLFLFPFRLFSLFPPKERWRINHSGARDLRPRLFPNDSGKCRFFREIRVIRESRFEARPPTRFSSVLRSHHGALPLAESYRSITS